MKMNKVLPVLTAAALLAGASMNVAADDSKELRLAWSKDIQTMDVHKTTDNYQIPLSVFDRLLEVQVNDDGSPELVKSIVDDYSVSDDGLVYSFTLRDGILFSDGSALTSEDVEATFNRMFTLPESVQTDFTTCIKGAQAILGEGIGVTLIQGALFYIATVLGLKKGLNLA